MFYSVAIPGILPAWAAAGINSETSLGPERARGSLAVVSQGGQVPQSLERPHTGMTTNKSRDASNKDTSPYSNESRVLDFGMLYEKFRRPIHAYIYRLLGSQEDADDLMQEVFTRAYVSWDDLYDRENLSPWLYRIATNLCVDLLRRRKRISWWPLLTPDSGGIPEVAEREHIRQALANMPADYAIVLVLNAAQGVPYQEIAAIVGISSNAAATRISRAKRMFVEQYQRISVTGSKREERSL